MAYVVNGYLYQNCECGATLIYNIETDRERICSCGREYTVDITKVFTITSNGEVVSTYTELVQP